MPVDAPKPSPPPTRADFIIEAILMVGEIRKPGYVLKVMRELINQDDPVTLLRPNATSAADEDARAEAVAWLEEAAIRARARAAARQLLKGERRR